MAGKTFQIDVKKRGGIDTIKGNLYRNTTLVKSRAKVIRDYGSMLKNGYVAKIQEIQGDYKILRVGPETIIRFSPTMGKFYCETYDDDGPYIYVITHILNKHGTLGKVIKKERF